MNSRRGREIILSRLVKEGHTGKLVFEHTPDGTAQAGHVAVQVKGTPNSKALRTFLLRTEAGLLMGGHLSTSAFTESDRELLKSFNL